ncbi:YbjQ family protein [Marinicellulosiphila megalodicopiae]|uniref:YbjQ family protein n=1 Tax=Marinicellulosiphila megalodicopiae TaxID=2724896 RepID=UPI003BB1552E
MIYSTTEQLAGKTIETTLGVVSGSVVQSKHLGRDIMAGLKTLIGGELVGMTEMLNEAREKAVQRMLAQAKHLNADAVVSVRFTTSTIMPGSSEILAFGTAVKFS